MLDPLSMVLADKATRRHVTSASPQAPTEPDRPTRRPRTAAGRVVVATMLRRLASRVEPRPAPTCEASS